MLFACICVVANVGSKYYGKNNPLRDYYWQLEDMPPKPRLFDQLNLGKEQKKRVEAVAKLSAYDVNRIQRRWTRKFRGRVLAAIEEHTFLLTFPCTCTSVFKCVCT